MKTTRKAGARGDEPAARIRTPAWYGSEFFCKLLLPVCFVGMVLLVGAIGWQEYYATFDERPQSISFWDALLLASGFPIGETTWNPQPWPVPWKLQLARVLGFPPEPAPLRRARARLRETTAVPNRRTPRRCRCHP